MPSFPFSPLRAGQEELIRDIQGIAAQGGVLLCSAPTGIGKTAAALWPMLERALADGRQLFFVTAKTSQQDLALQTLERLLEPGAVPAAVQVATRERHCPLDGRRCGEPLCTRRRATNRGMAEQLADDPSLAPRGVAHAEAIQALAEAHGLCPFELSLLWAETASAIVGDFNYVFDPRTYLRRFFDGPHGQQLLIVDEAHNLPDRVAGYDSPVLDRVRLRALARRCDALAEPPFDAAAPLLHEVEQRVERRLLALAEERAGPPPYVGRLTPSLLEGLEPTLEAVDEAYRSFVAERPGVASLFTGPSIPPGLDERERRDPLLTQIGMLRALARVSRQPVDHFAAIFEPDTVRVLCLEPGVRIRERVLGFHASVCMSATLTPFAFHQRRLGLEGPGILRVALPSPFPRHHRQLVCDPTIDTRRDAREREAPRVAALIARAARLRSGNYLAFFPSYAYRDRVASCWSRSERAELGILLQLPGVPAEALLGRLRANRGGTRILCGVHGGVLSEGVDYAGDLAVGVFIVGPGLPSVSLEREVLRAHYEGAGVPVETPDPEAPSSGFDLAYVHPGIQRVIQAGGRVIRTPQDRGFVLLIGQRFTLPQYRDKLPEDWREDLVTTEDPISALRAFWSRVEPGRLPGPHPPERRAHSP